MKVLVRTKKRLYIEVYMNKNFWGEPDDCEPMPDWMNPNTYKNNNPFKQSNKTVENTIRDVLKKPPIPIQSIEPIIPFNINNQKD